MLCCTFQQYAAHYAQCAAPHNSILHIQIVCHNPLWYAAHGTAICTWCTFCRCIFHKLVFFVCDFLTAAFRMIADHLNVTVPGTTVFITREQGLCRSCFQLLHCAVHTVPGALRPLHRNVIVSSLFFLDFATSLVAGTASHAALIQIWLLYWKPRT